jgi:hypothetical protein
MNGKQWVFRVQEFDKKIFDWTAIQRETAAKIIPTILAELRSKAPVSAVKPDAGRFRDSIGYRIETPRPGALKILFVSTVPYAEFVLNPTAGGSVIKSGASDTLALRWTDGFGDYVFAQSVIRGATPGNDFNKRVAERMKPYVAAQFRESIVRVLAR